MDKSFRPQGSGTRQPDSFLTVALHNFGRILRWLAALIHWTEEEQEDAGIYIDRFGDE